MKIARHFISVTFICIMLLWCSCRNGGNSEISSYSIDSLVYAKDSNAFNRSVIANTLDLKTFPPEKVIYKTWGNSADGQETSGLEAVLFYEEHMYGSILEKYMNDGFPKGDYKKEDFKFDWLDDAMIAELGHSTNSYKGNPDIFLGTQGKAKLWFLDKKILVKL